MAPILEPVEEQLFPEMFDHDNSNSASLADFLLSDEDVQGMDISEGEEEVEIEDEGVVPESSPAPTPTPTPAPTPTPIDKEPSPVNPPPEPESEPESDPEPEPEPLPSRKERDRKKIEDGRQFYADQTKHFFKHSVPRGDPKVDTFVPAQHCSICRGLFTEFGQSAVLSGGAKLRESHDGMLPLDYECGELLDQLAKASANGKMRQETLVRCLTRSIKACDAWQSEAQFARNKRLQSSIIWAATIGMTVELLLQRFQQLRREVGAYELRCSGSSEWLEIIFAADPKSFIYRGNPMTASIAKKFVKIARVFRSESQHWLMHAGLAPSFLYNLSDATLKEIQ